MSIETKTKYLLETKVLLRNAINRVGGNLSTTDPFRAYPEQLTVVDEPNVLLDFTTGYFSVGAGFKRNRGGKFSDVLTFTRSTGAGRYNELGMYEWVAADIPRINHKPATKSTSTTTNVIGIGSKTFQTTVQYAVGTPLCITHNLTNFMRGVVTASTASTATVDVRSVEGSGTYSSWTLIETEGLLMETQETNEIESSEFSAGISDATGENAYIAAYTGDFGPLGTTTGIELTTGAAESYVTVIQWLTEGTRTAFSFFVKMSNGAQPNIGEDVSDDFSLIVNSLAVSQNAGATVEVEPLGDGVYRVSVVFVYTTPPFGDGRFGIRRESGQELKSIYVTGFQVEASTSVRKQTSYIRTSGTTTTRASEYTSLANGIWFNKTEGTVFAEGYDNNAQKIVSIGTSISDYYANVGNDIIANTAEALTRTGGTVQADINIPFTSQIPKYAYAYKTNDVAFCVDGSAVGTDTSVTLPTTDAAMYIGTGLGVSVMAGVVKRIKYIPRRLTNIELQELTS